MDEGSSRLPSRSTQAAATLKKSTRLSARRGLAGIGVALCVYSVATALLVYRAPAMLGDDWSWLALVLIPVLTLLMGGLRTGTAMALVVLYAFASATVMAVQGYRLGWTEVTQVGHVLSHFSTVFFMAGAVALIAQIRSLQYRMEQSQELVRRYVSEDDVTGLLTREAFERAASRELSRSCRTSRPFLLLAIDLSEYFRPGGGSAAVAVAERMLGQILSAQTRGNQDLWTMWDKDVYLGLLTETDYQGVEPVLGRVLSRIAQSPEFAGQALVESARFGVASCPADGYALDALLELSTSNLVPLQELRSRLEGSALTSPKELTTPDVHK